MHARREARGQAIIIHLVQVCTLTHHPGRIRAVSTPPPALLLAGWLPAYPPHAPDMISTRPWPPVLVGTYCTSMPL